MVRHRRAIAAALLLLGASSLSCDARTATKVVAEPRESAVPSQRASLAPEPLLVIGDSIMVGARDFGNLNGLLESSGWTTEIVAEVGQGIPWALDQVQQRASVPPVVVVELGTNPSPRLDGFETEVLALIDALRQRGAKRIVWIPPEAIDPSRYAERAQVIARASSSTVIVSSWPGQLEMHPEWFMTDGIHLTQQGCNQLAVFIRDELVRLHA
ncbi:MAG: hypothetical protein ACXVQY_12515 [Actinomycetota bacterium]